MTDEKIIYLGPEEDLTSVSERLEKTNAGRITLVIPPQTQLHSLVGWRLLHARMRKLGKDVLVISSERQIRSVAKAAGFRIADSQESSPSAKRRPSSHPSRSGTGGKTPQSSQNLPGRGSPENRAQRQRQLPNQPRVATNDRQQMQQTQRKTSGSVSRADEMLSGSDTGAASSTYGRQDTQFRSPKDLHIDTSPSIRPHVPGQVDDEPDTWTADYNVSQSIREAAQGTDAGTVSPAAGTREPSSGIPRQESQTSLPAGNEHDPFAYMEDLQPASLPEQRGSTHIDDIESGIPDIADVPTDEFEYQIEDMGDEGAVFLQQDFSPPPWSEPAVEEPGRVEMPRGYGTPPRNSRMGKLPLQDIDDEEKLPPVPEQPTYIMPSPSAAVRSPAMPTPSTVGNRQQPPNYQQPQNIIPTKTKIETFFWLTVLFVILVIICLIVAGVISISFRILWYLATSLIVIFVLIFVWRGYTRSWSAWTGFGKYKSQRAKTLWDWFQLSGIIAIPIIAVLIPVWLSALHNQDLQLAQIQHKNDLQFAQNQQQQAILEMYLDRMSDLILNKSLNDPKIAVEMRVLVRTRTLIALSILDPGRKVILIQFLYEAHLIDAKGPIIDLSGADLRYITLDLAHLDGVDLSGVDMSGANLNRAFLDNANLSNTNLNDATLIGASLNNTDLNGANLNNADLSDVNLLGAKVTNEQLAKAKSLNRATMPDGSQHP